MTTEGIEPINENLDRLAALAESEDREPEYLPGEEEAAAERVEAQELDDKTTRNLAAAIIGGLAWMVEMLWGVDYEKKTRDEGTDKLQPCLQFDNMPPWLQVVFGRYWPFLVFGAFLTMTGVSTYAIIQERKRREQDDDDKGGQEQPPVDWMKRPAGGGEFRTAGA